MGPTTRIRRYRQLAAAVCLASGLAAAPLARAQPVEIFAAGSLRTVVGELATDARSAFGVEVKAEFGGSGTLRERIEKGASPDLFLSADLASPRRLQALGRTVVPVIPFARNRVCIVSRGSLHVTAGDLIDRLLATDTRIKTSNPSADPGGAYAFAIFDRIEALHPGSGALLEEKARRSMQLTARPARANQSAAAALFASKQIDVLITYCSGAPALEKQVPGLASLPVPAPLDPHPIYGAAVLSSKPEAMRLMLYLLSDKGQLIVSNAGLVPLASPGNSR